MFSNKFYTYDTDVWCKKPESLSELSTKDWLHLSAPMKTVGNETVHSQCEMFDIEYNRPMKLKRPNENAASVECKSWDYNTTYFDVSISLKYIGCILLLYINVSLVVEFLKWWVLKSMIFDQKSIYRTRAIISRGLYIFLPHFPRPFMYCDLWPYVWLVFKSGF